MGEEAKRYFTQLLNKVSGLQYILIHDRDGIILMKLANVNWDLREGFLNIFGIASEQASKMGSGKSNNIISIFSNYQVIQMNKMPLVLTFVGTENMNIGHVLAVEHEINGYLDDFKVIVSDPM